MSRFARQLGQREPKPADTYAAPARNSSPPGPHALPTSPRPAGSHSPAAPSAPTHPTPPGPSKCTATHPNPSPIATNRRQTPPRFVVKTRNSGSDGSNSDLFFGQGNAKGGGAGGTGGHATAHACGDRARVHFAAGAGGAAARQRSGTTAAALDVRPHLSPTEGRPDPRPIYRHQHPDPVPPTPRTPGPAEYAPKDA